VSRLITSVMAIYRWLGKEPLRRSDNLKLPGPVKARLARVYWRVAQERAEAEE